MANLQQFRDLGIYLQVSPSKTEIAFAYLHPLSKPGLAPKLSQITCEDPIVCQGKVILRFGFIEGDAIVHGDRVVYDPQSSHFPSSFGANGSSANSLAIVLSEGELRAFMPDHTTSESANALLARDHADVVVIKRGPNGAVVFEKSQNPFSIPAYQTPRICKIGSGDVFSAAFVHYWGVERRSAPEASELASRCTATYCSSQSLPLPRERELPIFPPVDGNASLQVCVVGVDDTLANHWLVEESRWCLIQMGLDTHICHISSEELGTPLHFPATALILADTFADGGQHVIRRAQANRLPIVILQERRTIPREMTSTLRATDDFTTALYWAAWARM